MTFGYRNMAVVRLCLVFLLVLSVERIAGKPFFGSFLCDLFCDDDDDVSSTTNSSEDDYDWWGRPIRRTTPSSVILPAIPGVSYNLTNSRNRLVVLPVQDSAGSANSPAAQTTTVTRVTSVATRVPGGATTAASGATTAASGATTAAAGATTAAAGATPAAATTAATTPATTAAPAA